MSPRGPGSRILGAAAGFPTRARRALARLDPGAWVIRHRRADVYLPAALLATCAAAVTLVAEPVLHTAIMLSPLAFILLVAIRAHRANAAQRNRAKDEIKDTHRLVSQCTGHLRLLSGGLPDSRGARLVTDRLSSGIGLLITRYRRYLSEAGVVAAIKAESLVLKAGIAGAGKIAGRVRAIEFQLDIVGNEIRKVTDPPVGDELGRVWGATSGRRARSRARFRMPPRRAPWGHSWRAGPACPPGHLFARRGLPGARARAAP